MLRALGGLFLGSFFDFSSSFYVQIVTFKCYVFYGVFAMVEKPCVFPFKTSISEAFCVQNLVFYVVSQSPLSKTRRKIAIFAFRNDSNRVFYATFATPAIGYRVFYATFSLCGSIWASVGLCGPLWVYFGLCGPIWASVGLSGPL